MIAQRKLFIWFKEYFDVKILWIDKNRIFQGNFIFFLISIYSLK